MTLRPCRFFNRSLANPFTKDKRSWRRDNQFWRLRSRRNNKKRNWRQSNMYRCSWVWSSRSVTLATLAMEGTGMWPFWGIKPVYEPANPLQLLIGCRRLQENIWVISIPGVYGAIYDQFPPGQLFNHELQIRMGQCPVKRYYEQLLHLIETGR
jgi:hypothetical protein